MNLRYIHTVQLLGSRYCCGATRLVQTKNDSRENTVNLLEPSCGPDWELRLDMYSVGTSSLNPGLNLSLTAVRTKAKHVYSYMLYRSL